MEMAARCGNMEFSLYGEEGYEMVEGVKKIMYLGRTLYQTDDDWTAVRSKIMHTK